MVFVTLDFYEKALALANLLLEQRFIACVQISPIQKFYAWKWKVEEAQEFLMTCKTRTSLLIELTAVIRIHHPYEVPEIVATEIIGGSETYFQWVMDGTKHPS